MTNAIQALVNGEAGPADAGATTGCPAFLREVLAHRERRDDGPAMRWMRRRAPMP